MTPRNATIHHLRATGLKIREIAAQVGVSTHTVERVIYGNNTPYVPRPTEPVTLVHRQCLMCREWFDLPKVIFRCDACHQATADVVCDALAVGCVGGKREGVE